MTFGVLQESFASENVLAFELLRGRWKSACGGMQRCKLFSRVHSDEELCDRCEEGTSAYCIWDADNPTVIVGQEEIEIAPTTRILPDHQISPPHRNCPLSPVPDILTAKTVCLSSILTPDCGARDA